MQIFSLLLRMIWIQITLIHENTLHVEFLYHWDLYCILYNLNWLCLKCLHASIYGSHSIKIAYIERENIRIHVHPYIFFLFLKFGLCLFIFPHLLHFFQSYFSQNLFCFAYFYRGRKLVLKPMLFIRRVITLRRGSCLYFL